MKTYVKEKIEVRNLNKVQCDVCKKEANIEDVDEMSFIQEMTHISYTGGYGSIFGDMNKIELDICDKCLNEQLGNFIRVN